MISIEDAIQTVIENCGHNSKSINVPILKAGNSTLFSDVCSPINMPPFRQSAMDGYALNLHDDFTYSLIGEVKAGDIHNIELNKGEAIRIFTGAAVPDSANAVIMQEKVTVSKNAILIEATLSINHNIRSIGEQVKQGEIALKKGTKLTPAAIGYLSSLGISEVSVYKKPSIALITTGNELIEAGEPLAYGKIYESNSKMLQTALLSLGFDDVSIHKIDDNYNDTFSKIKSLLEIRDMIIITGGISVGDYDFVGKALKELQVNQIFYKVNQKPGKPLYFGKNNRTLIFALPGNPAAALSCFYIYVYTALQKMMGLQEVLLPKIMAKSNSEFLKSGDRPQFLKAYYNGGKLTILEGQSSSMLQTFAVSNALVIMKEDLMKININDVVEVVLLPF
ncbi:MAG: molybdopterin molybdotransferase MoeA [Flavobacteriales bacterium]|nr:molybdopterin molybdotransferase MoeA [Flavobacteriales bacterium]PIV94094.1 MAG: molybdopterin molybdenumtransferase MoeA [Flavobacteriaceae bacterium CG17_big_fil_post_rev_8_21_14_2_50_33_15]PJB17268.1 MAG: molybdopterin molybdenumtransferase MoeA [Flavobacteriaceae bacterium CG_4_9_14_3_um_filter_33_16]